MATKKDSKQVGILKRCVMNGKFDDADELLQNGHEFPEDMLLTTIFRNDFEAFQYVYPKKPELDSHDVYHMSFNEIEKDPRFAQFVFDEKERNPGIQSFFENPDECFHYLDRDFTKIRFQLEYDLRKIIPTDKEYQIDLEVFSLKLLKSQILSVENLLKTASDLDQHIHFQQEDKLQIMEWEVKAAAYHEIYDIFMMNRMEYSTNMKDLVQEKRGITEKMWKIREEATENNKKALENKFG